MEKKRYYVGMRRFIILSSFIIGFVSFFISYKKKEDTSLLAKLEQMMYRTKMNVHCDPFYGYQILFMVTRYIILRSSNRFRIHSFMKRDVASSILGIC